MVVHDFNIVVIKHMMGKQQYNFLLSLPKDKEIEIMNELGFDKQIKTSDQFDADTMRGWCEDFLQDDAVLHINFLHFDLLTETGKAEYYWYFQNPKDAMLFKLKWC